MNHVTFIPYLSNSFRSRGEPTSPAKRPREMSSDESSPPYEPSHPATASTSTPTEHRIFFDIVCPPCSMHTISCPRGGASDSLPLQQAKARSKAHQHEHVVST